MMTRIFSLLAVLVLVSACAGALDGASGGSSSGGSGSSSASSGSSGSSSGSGSGSSGSSSASTGEGDSGRARSSDQQGLVEAIGEAVAGADERVYFSFDSSALDTTAREVLDAQVGFLRANGGLRLTIEGHADERGTREYNLALGERRAAAVRDYLVASGIDFSRIDTISYGKERPDVIGSNELAWSQNRRAVSLVR